MSNEALEYKNENVTVGVVKEAGCKVKVNVIVSPKAADAAWLKAVKHVNKEVSIPGFRKGKAPDAMIVQKFDKYIKDEWKDILVKTAFQESLNLTKIYPFSENSIKRPDFKAASREGGAIINYEYEYYPEIPSVDLAELQIKNVEKIPVTQKDIDDTVENIRYHHAQWEDIKDHPIQEGDFVDLDIDTLEPPEQKICEDQRFKVAEGAMGSWMRKLIIGSKTGDRVEGISEKEPHKHENGKDCQECKDEAEGHAHPEFKPTRCLITIKGVKKPLLPELNDELAQKVGAPSVDVLMERIANDLNRQAEERANETMRKEAEDLILDKYPFDIPASIMEPERKSRLHSRLQALKSQNIPDTEIVLQAKQVEKEVIEEIERAFRLFFLSRKVAEEHNINVTQEELLKEMMREMYLNPNQRAMDQTKDPSEVRSRLYVTVLSQKVADFLVEKSKKI